MLEARVRVVNPLGLHARASAQLVHLAEQFESQVRVIRDDTKVEADAGSLLDLLHLAATCGQELRVTANGPDEAEALTSIARFFNDSSSPVDQR